MSKIANLTSLNDKVWLEGLINFTYGFASSTNAFYLRGYNKAIDFLLTRLQSYKINLWKIN
jgi:hypothetical protein